MKTQNNQSSLIGINDIVKFYLPVSKRLARKFVSTYLDCKLIGNRIFVGLGENEDIQICSDLYCIYEK